MLSLGSREKETIRFWGECKGKKAFTWEKTDERKEKTSNAGSAKLDQLHMDRLGGDPFAFSFPGGDIGSPEYLVYSVSK
jgi:hypothetical protein